MYPVKTVRKRTFTLPAVFDKILAKGDRFMAIADNDDAILLRRVKEPVWRTASRFPDPDQMTLEEIDKLVHKARHEIAKPRKK